MQRTLGRSETEVSAIGMGCWAIGGEFGPGTQPWGWGKVDDSESVGAIHAALEHGVTFFDTADVYGCGHSERILGRALRGRREEVVIATKFGHQFDESSKQVYGTNSSPDYIRAACAASLERLQTDYLDLYQLHFGLDDLDDAPRVRDTLETLVAEGKIRAYGWSTDDPARAAIFALGEHCAAIQHQQNIFEDNAVLLELCEHNHLSSINRGPLGMGILTGKFSSGAALEASDIRHASPEWMAYFKDGKPNPQWLTKLESVREILCTGGRTLAQGALAWLLARSPNTLPIPGFRTVKQVEENAAVLEQGPLSRQQMQDIVGVLKAG